MIDAMLAAKLDNVKKVMKKGWDVIFLIDGIEGCGKSTLSFICGWYITEGKLTLTNICEGSSNAVDKLRTLPDGSVLIIDEGSLLFASKDVMRKEQRRLEKVLQVIRQKQMCLIIVAPSFFNLNRYVSVDRTRFLLHVYTDRNLQRGRFTYFSQKKKNLLYSIGKKNYNSYAKPKSDWIGQFASFAPFGSEYDKMKKKALFDALDDKKVEIKSELDIRREVVANISNNLPITTKKGLCEVLNVSIMTLNRWEKAAMPLTPTT